ncbi:MAG: flagellin lysine-N-methylase [Clostridia bacterium]|nr:flagellin lysine-N-methylase [Clostridia bacterium]
MELYAPKYYRKFKCIADRCTHSCCIGWEIDVDDDTLALYRTLPGKVGEDIRRSLACEGDAVCFALGADERCPHLTEKGLCAIISALGEGYLCEICREHPRFYNRVGERLECGLGASCEEAARLILSEADYLNPELVGEEPIEPNEGECGFDGLAARRKILALLSDRRVTYAERRRQIAACWGLPLENRSRQSLFASLEYLQEAHRELFLRCCDADVSSGEADLAGERFLAYLIYRHASPAESAEDFRSALWLAFLLERLFRSLTVAGLSPVEAAVTVSEELEYSEDNTEAIRQSLAESNE